jgi:Pyruvate/2-oxoacid:ferredoxin oxidoreductase delta subunit
MTFNQPTIALLIAMKALSASKAATLGRLRLLSQSLFAAFCILVGLQFYQFYLWAINDSADIVRRPPAVEAFLPLGALVSLKRLVLSGEYDAIHPAGLTIFLAALFLGLFLRKGFCGWICPIGFASNLAERIGKKLRMLVPYSSISCEKNNELSRERHLSRSSGLVNLQALPNWIDIPLLCLKYLLLGFFAWLILWRMNLGELTAFHYSSYNMISDAKMLNFFLEPSQLAGSIMLALLLLSFVIKNLWCRYLCPYGALLGLLAVFSPFQIKRDKTLCIDCKKCEAVCPGSIQITARQTVRDCECIGCLECLPVCPKKECLTLSLTGKATIRPTLLPTLIIGTFLLFWLGARVTGHWQSQISPETFQRYYQQIHSINHP